MRFTGHPAPIIEIHSRFDWLSDLSCVSNVGDLDLADLLKPTGVDLDRFIDARLARAEHPVSTFISCWHRSDHESAAMWEIYQREGRGVVLQTTWGRLTTSLDDPRTIGGYVTYADYAKTLPPFDHELNIYFNKRPHFEFEREVRLMCVDRSHDPDSPPVTTGQLYPRPHQSLTLRAP